MYPKARQTAPPILTDGLIIRTFNKVGEADRFITVLTRDRGVIRAAARGAQKFKSRSGSATQLLCFSRLRLIAGRDAYIVEDAKPLEVFFKLREDIVKTALAQYFCELAGALAPTEEPAEEHLRLLLNALHFLAEDKRPQTLLKAVVEWRLLTLAGYMPQVSGCEGCGKPDGDMLLSTVGGGLYCLACAPGGCLPLPKSAVEGLRRTVMGELSDCFQFSLPDPALHAFSEAAESFLKAQLQRSFRTLDFYHSLETGACLP